MNPAVFSILAQLMICLPLLALVYRLNRNRKIQAELSLPFPVILNGIVGAKEIKNETLVKYLNDGKKDYTIIKDKQFFQEKNMNKVVTLMILPRMGKEPQFKIVPNQIPTNRIGNC